MEDALLFQAQAEETCSLWQAGGQAPSVGRDGGHEGPQDPAVHIQPRAAPEAALLLQTPCIPRVNSVGLALRNGCLGGPAMGGPRWRV